MRHTEEDELDEFKEIMGQLTPHDRSEMLGYAIVLEVCLKFHTHPPKSLDNPIPQTFYYLIGAARGAQLRLLAVIHWRWETFCDLWVIGNWMLENRNK